MRNYHPCPLPESFLPFLSRASQNEGKTADLARSPLLYMCGQADMSSVPIPGHSLLQPRSMARPKVGALSPATHTVAQMDPSSCSALPLSDDSAGDRTPCENRCRAQMRRPDLTQRANLPTPISDEFCRGEPLARPQTAISAANYDCATNPSCPLDDSDRRPGREADRSVAPQLFTREGARGQAFK